MKDQEHTYVVSYDIVDDRRRDRTAAVLLSFGHRLQASVFVIKARRSALVRLRDAVKKRLMLARTQWCFWI